MDIWNVLSDIVLLLSVALVLGMLFERLRQSAVTGYLITGLCLGPSGFGFIVNVAEVQALAEIGVALLLFTIGLEFSWRRLRELGAVPWMSGLLQIVITILLGTWVASIFVSSLAEALVIGAAVALSSTAVVLRILTDRAELESLPGRNALGILLLQDLAVVPLILLLSVLGEEVTGAAALGHFSVRILQAAALVGAIFLVNTYVIPRVLHAASAFRNRDLPVLLAFGVCLGAAAASHALDQSPILGAFVAGMLLAESPFADQVRADIIPLRAVFLTLFFTSIGTLVQLPSPSAVLTLLLVVISIVVGKTLLLSVIIVLLRQPTQAAIATGLILSQIGEFSFVLLQLGYRQELVGQDTFQLLLAAAVLTLLLSPYVIVAAPRVAAAVAGLSPRLSPPVGKIGISPTDRAGKAGHVIIVGFGPAGKAVAEALRKTEIPYVVVELNLHSVSALRPSLPIEFGDATRPEILERLHLNDARALVVTVPDSETARLIIRQARLLAPSVRVIARARYHAHASRLHQAGADQLVDEETLVGHRLGAEVLSLD